MSEAIIIAIIGLLGSIITTIIGALTTIGVEKIKAQKDKTSSNQSQVASPKRILIVMLISAFVGLVLGVFLATTLLKHKDGQSPVSPNPIVTPAPAPTVPPNPTVTPAPAPTVPPNPTVNFTPFPETPTVTAKPTMTPVPSVNTPALRTFGNNDPQEFMAAAKRGDIVEIKAFISDGIDVNIKDEDGRTALMLAATNDHFEVMKFLIANGADVDVKDIHGNTAWLYSPSSTGRRILENAASD